MWKIESGFGSILGTCVSMCVCMLSVSFSEPYLTHVNLYEQSSFP